MKPNLPEPRTLLSQPQLVLPVAPWCRLLDNLELCALLLAEPWITEEGLRRADLERQLAHLATEMPVGPVYFQRVNRAVGALTESGAMESDGRGRSRRFRATPRGFAALIVNLRVLTLDPTIDGSEFELKRALISMWNLAVERLLELPVKLSIDAACERFFDELDRVEIWGHRLVTAELLQQALDPGVLVAEQRSRVEALLAAAEQKLAQLSGGGGPELDFGRLASEGFAGVETLLASDPETRAAVRRLATRSAPRLTQRAKAARYRAYLGYLDELEVVHRNGARVVDLEQFRRRMEGRSA